jgi:RNA methyltransferase, TrmH family
VILPKYPVISSIQNPVFKELLQSLEGQGDHILVHGFKVARDLIAKGSLRPRTLIARESFSFEKSKAVAELFQTRFPEAVTRLVLTDALFNEVDPFGVPDIIVAFDRPTLPFWTLANAGAETEPMLIVATQNPANLGACLRSAAAFGLRKVVCLKESASPFHPRTVRGSVGTVFNLELFRGPSIHEVTKPNSEISNRLVALHMEGTALQSFQWPAAPLILIGEEGQGVPDSFTGQRVKIPMQADVESLNAAVSAGIALYDWSIKSSSSPLETRK